LLQCNTNSGYGFCRMSLPRFWADYYIPIYTTHPQELMKVSG
jgi:hypothetical protein